MPLGLLSFVTYFGWLAVSVGFIVDEIVFFSFFYFWFSLLRNVSYSLSCVLLPLLSLLMSVTQLLCLSTSPTSAAVFLFHTCLSAENRPVLSSSVFSLCCKCKCTSLILFESVFSQKYSSHMILTFNVSVTLRYHNTRGSFIGDQASKVGPQSFVIVLSKAQHECTFAECLLMCLTWHCY